MKKNKILGIVMVVVAMISTGYYFVQNSRQNSLGAAASTTPITDNRVQVTDQKDVQYQSSVLINSVKKQSEFGTGYVVDKNTVVTNRHVVLESKDHPEEGVVRIGHKDKDGKVEFVDFKIDKILLPQDESLDVAVIKVLPREDGKTLTDYRKAAEFGDSGKVKEGSKLTVVGFPGDKEYATMWAGTGEVDMKMDNIISFKAVTAPGNSGSPLFDEEGKVVAMNNAGGDNNSFGFLINDAILSFIRSHME